MNVIKRIETLIEESIEVLEERQTQEQMFQAGEEARKKELKELPKEKQTLEDKIKEEYADDTVDVPEMGTANAISDMMNESHVPQGLLKK